MGILLDYPKVQLTGYSIPINTNHLIQKYNISLKRPGKKLSFRWLAFIDMEYHEICFGST